MAATVSEIEPLLTIQELADLARQSRRYIEKKISEGEIKVIRYGRTSVRIRPEEARRYLNDPAGSGNIQDQANPE